MRKDRAYAGRRLTMGTGRGTLGLGGKRLVAWVFEGQR